MLELLLLNQLITYDFLRKQEEVCRENPQCYMEPVMVYDEKNKPLYEYDQCNCIYLCRYEPEKPKIMRCDTIDRDKAFEQDG